MPELDEVLADLDEDQQAAIRAALKAKEDALSQVQAEAQAKERALKIKTDDEFAKKYPRAIDAIRKGKITDPGDDEALAAKEAEYESLGVADPFAARTAPEPPADPAAGWGAATEGGSTAPPMDIGTRLTEAMETGKGLDIVQLQHIAQEERQQALLEQMARRTCDETWGPILPGGCQPVR